MDIHVHTAFKPFVSSENLEDRLNCWDKIPYPIRIIRSQSCLDQLVEGNVNLAVVAIVPIEMGFATSFLVKYLAPLVTFLDRNLINDISTQFYFYNDLFYDELATLEANQEFEGRSFQFINSMSEFDPEKLNIIMAAEGAHCLDGDQPVLEKLDQLKNGPHRMLYMTLVHLTKYRFCTMCFGLKIINNRIYWPKGFGIDEWGWRVIEQSYDTQTGRRLLIDIKHMSLVSRQQFYQWRKDNNLTHIPIIASHMGIAGYAQADIYKYINGPVIIDEPYCQVTWTKPPGIGSGDDATFFNPWTINLLDDDIPHIVESGGLIGMNLDARILGAKDIEPEYFSLQEFQYLTNGQSISYAQGELYPEGDDTTEEILGDLTESNENADNAYSAAAIERAAEAIGEAAEKEAAAVLSDLAEAEAEAMGTESIAERRLGIRSFINNILHIVEVGGPKAWDCISMGSDFDGLIDPITCALSTTDYPKLERQMVLTMITMINESGKDYYVEPRPDAIEKKVRDIMYNNGIRFLEQHYTDAGNTIQAPRNPQANAATANPNSGFLASLRRFLQNLFGPGAVNGNSAGNRRNR